MIQSNAIAGLVLLLFFGTLKPFSEAGMGAVNKLLDTKPQARPGIAERLANWSGYSLWPAVGILVTAGIAIGVLQRRRAKAPAIAAETSMGRQATTANSPSQDLPATASRDLRSTPTGGEAARVPLGAEAQEPSHPGS